MLNNNLRKAQQGFTLIELMIVVAIIGILAAIALPAYQDYTARAQATEALTATAGVRAEIAVYLSEEGDFPANSADIDDADIDLAGRYFSAGDVTLGAGGVLSVAFDDGVHAGETMTITPTESAAGGQIERWTCAGLPEIRHIPRACQ